MLIAGDSVIGEGWNQPIASSDPTAHAEILAMRAGANFPKKLSPQRAQPSTLLWEPCPMCMGAVLNARVTRVVFGAWDAKARRLRQHHRSIEAKRISITASMCFWRRVQRRIRTDAAGLFPRQTLADACLIEGRCGAAGASCPLQDIAVAAHVVHIAHRPLRLARVAIFSLCIPKLLFQQGQELTDVLPGIWIATGLLCKDSSVFQMAVADVVRRECEPSAVRFGDVRGNLFVYLVKVSSAAKNALSRIVQVGDFSLLSRSRR